MPCVSWSIPATKCAVGSLLRKVPGSTCASCYALKGCYVFKSTKEAMERRFASLPAENAAEGYWSAWEASHIDALRDRAARKPLAGDDPRYFRWHDSGDVQNERHFRAILNIARNVPEVSFWLPTREYRILRTVAESDGIPDNVTVRLSVPMIGRRIPQAHAELAAAHEGITLSEVHDTAQPRKGASGCPAYTNDGACGDCRTCWDRDVPSVSYPKH